MPERSLVIKVTAGKDDPERCNQAFTVAAAAVASGVSVSLWLTGESAWFGLPGRAGDFSLPHAAPLADLLAGVLAAGSVTVCTQCAARRNIEAGDLISGIRIAGAATFVAEIMTDGAQALLHQVFLPGVDRRQCAGHPAEQHVGQAGVADEGGPVQVGADHPAAVRAFRPVPVADAGDHGGQRLRPRPAPGHALLVLESGEPAGAERRIDVRDY